MVNVIRQCIQSDGGPGRFSFPAPVGHQEKVEGDHAHHTVMFDQLFDRFIIEMPLEGEAGQQRIAVHMGSGSHSVIKVQRIHGAVIFHVGNIQHKALFSHPAQQGLPFIGQRILHDRALCSRAPASAGPHRTDQADSPLIIKLQVIKRAEPFTAFEQGHQSHRMFAVRAAGQRLNGAVIVRPAENAAIHLRMISRQPVIEIQLCTYRGMEIFRGLIPCFPVFPGPDRNLRRVDKNGVEHDPDPTFLIFRPADRSLKFFRTVIIFPVIRDRARIIEASVQAFTSQVIMSVNDERSCHKIHYNTNLLSSA